jgi:hypothetical protein
MEGNLRSKFLKGIKQTRHGTAAHFLVAVQIVGSPRMQAQESRQEAGDRSRVADVEICLGVGYLSAQPMDFYCSGSRIRPHIKPEYAEIINQELRVPAEQSPFQSHGTGGQRSQDEGAIGQAL